MTQGQNDSPKAPGSVGAIVAVVVLTATVLGGVAFLFLSEDEDGPVAPVKPAGGSNTKPKRGSYIGMEMNVDTLKRDNPKLGEVYDAIDKLTRAQDYKGIFDLFHPDYQVEWKDRIEHWQANIKKLIAGKSRMSPGTFEADVKQFQANLVKLGYPKGTDITEFTKLSPREVFARQYKYMMEKGGRRGIYHFGIGDVSKGELLIDENDKTVLVDPKDKRVIILKPISAGHAFFILNFEAVDSDDPGAKLASGMPSGGVQHQLLVRMIWTTDENAGEPSWKITDFRAFDWKYAPEEEEAENLE